jgi:3-deoxy-7-phosphoheptulonate synthase
MKTGAREEQIQEVIQRIEELGYKSHVIRGTQRTVMGAVGDERGKARLQSIESMPGVESVVPILQPFKLASREVKPAKTVVKVGDLEIGGQAVVVMAGPCSVESESQMLETARAVKAAGATVLRGGAFKPRTSPYSFQGLAEEGLKLLDLARAETGLKIVTEVVNPMDAELVAEYADILQIGARNAQNFALLKKVGEVGKPVLLKRGMARDGAKTSRIRSKAVARRVYPFRRQLQRGPLRARDPDFRNQHALHAGLERGPCPQ